MSATYAAFDLGARHIGVAISDPETGFAFVRPTIEVQSEAEALLALTDMVTALQPTAVVIGWPLSMSGEVGPEAKKVEAFVTKLRPRLPCEIHLVDERMTTLEAHRHGADTNDHGEAARLILEKFLARSL